MKKLSDQECRGGDNKTKYNVLHPWSEYNLDIMNIYGLDLS